MITRQNYSAFRERLILLAIALGISAAALGPLLFTGCAAFKDYKLTPASIENKAEGVTTIVAARLLQKHPEYRDKMEIAMEDLRTLSNSTNIAVPEVMEIVGRLPIDAFNSSDAELYIGATIIIFKDELSQIGVEQPAQLHAAVVGMARALAAVLHPPVTLPAPRSANFRPTQRPVVEPPFRRAIAWLNLSVTSVPGRRIA